MGSLVIELQNAALNPDKSVSTLLRMSLLVATKLRLDEFEAWVKCELSGYTEGSTIPAYRTVRGELRVHDPIRGLVTIDNEYEVVKKLAEQFGNDWCLLKYSRSVSDIEQALSQKNSRPCISMSWLLPDAQPVWEFGEASRMQTMLSMPRSQMNAILEYVRSEIVRWSGALEQQGILGKGMSFSPEEERKATTAGQVINYSNCNVVHNPSGSVGQQIGDHNKILP